MKKTIDEVTRGVGGPWDGVFCCRHWCGNGILPALRSHLLLPITPTYPPPRRSAAQNKLQSLERAVRYALQGLAERRIGERELAQILDAQAVMVSRGAGPGAGPLHHAGHAGPCWAPHLAASVRHASPTLPHPHHYRPLPPPPPLPTHPPTPPTLQAILRHYDDLLLVLAPYLHKDRYSSYGRHFTAPKLLHAVAERCERWRAVHALSRAWWCRRAAPRLVARRAACNANTRTAGAGSPARSSSSARAAAWRCSCAAGTKWWTSAAATTTSCRTSSACASSACACRLGCGGSV